MRFAPAILAPILLMGLATSAGAINRYQSEELTCGEVQSIIDSEGAAIMRYSSRISGKPLFDRYVADRGFCATGEFADRETVPTADTEKCPVLACEYCDDDDRRFGACGLF